MNRKTDHNRTMLNGKVHWQLTLPYKRITEYRSRRGIGGEAGSSGGAGKKKDTLQNKEDVLLCRELLDDVRTYFESEHGCPF